MRDGIEDVHILGLTAMEIQILRTNVIERVATEEEIGLVPRKALNEMIVEVFRGTAKKRDPISLDDKIKKGDFIWSMTNAIARDYEHLHELKEIARNLDVEISVHTPYYMDLIAENDLTIKSINSIRWAGILAKELGATIVTTHLGMYGNVSKKTAAKRIKQNIEFIRDWYLENGIDVPLGVETSGRQEIFGEFKEIVKLCKEVEGLVPIINFSHIHARGNGALKKKEDFQNLFDTIAQFVNNKFNTNFSGVEHEDGNEIRYTPIKKGDLKFEPLAECILDNDFDITIICGSPLLEHDATYMKVILERVLAKREAKAERQRLKEDKKEEKAENKNEKKPPKTAPKKAPIKEPKKETKTDRKQAPKKKEASKPKKAAVKKETKPSKTTKGKDMKAGTKVKAAKKKK